MSSTSSIARPGSISWLRTTRKQPCPVCGRPGWCEFSRDGTLAHCMRTTTGGRPIQSRGGGRLFELRPAGSSSFQSNKRGKSAHFCNSADSKDREVGDQPWSEEVSRLSPAQLDAVFRALLERCPLSERHRDYLQRAGVPIVVDLGTLWGNRAHQLGWHLVEQFGEEIATSHPLLLRKSFSNSKVELKGQKSQGREQTIRRSNTPPSLSYWTLAGAGNGLLLPATNYQGLIVGMQIRYDRPYDPSQRYRWLSSPGKGSTPLTVFKAITAHAGAGNRDTQLPELENELLVITEGYKKAAAVSYAWGNPAISLAGVSAYRQEELVDTIRALGVNRIALAFDQDKGANPAVQQAEAKLLRILQANFPQVEVYLLEWDGTQGKGLDDALRAGITIRCLPFATLSSGSRNQNAQILPPEGKLTYCGLVEVKPSSASQTLPESDQRAQWETLKQAQRHSSRFNQVRQK